MFNSISFRNHNDDTFASAENVWGFFHVMVSAKVVKAGGVASGGHLELLENQIRVGKKLLNKLIACR